MDVVETLNREHQYPVRILSNEGHKDIENVSTVDGKNPDAVTDAIANADIMATALDTSSKLVMELTKFQSDI